MDRKINGAGTVEGIDSGEIVFIISVLGCEWGFPGPEFFGHSWSWLFPYIMHIGTVGQRRRLLPKWLKSAEGGS